MTIFPAIDIKDGRCVRLIQGEFNKQTIYSDNPVEKALEWEQKGAKFIHLVDLDGAKKGEVTNLEAIIEIVKMLKIPVQVGGGIRTLKNIDNILSHGVNRVILGTSALKDRHFLTEAVSKYKERIVVGIDARDGLVAIEGWTQKSNINSIEFASSLSDIGVQTIIYTDISKDGMLEGPNFEMTEEMVKNSNIDIIASGGVSSMMDVKKLKEIGVKGIIIGKALYTGNIILEEALLC